MMDQFSVYTTPDGRRFLHHSVVYIAEGAAVGGRTIIIKELDP